MSTFLIALALQQLGRYEEMIAELTHFNLVYDLVRDRALRDRAGRFIGSACRRTGELTLEVGPNASVHIDGVERSRPRDETRRFTLDPGRHVMVVHAPRRVSSVHGPHATRSTAVAKCADARNGTPALKTVVSGPTEAAGH